MIVSILLIVILGVIIRELSLKINIPPLIGMILVGIVVGPSFLNIIDKSFLNYSSYIRQLALIIIITRAGLSLNIKDLKAIGRSAFLMCFVPALFEIIAMTFLAPIIIGISYIEAALLGCVIAAVSPAIIVPKMLTIIKEGYGSNKSIPQLILAGASVDDIFVIVLFTSFLNLCKGNDMSYIGILNIPISIVLGIILGIVLGYVLVYVYRKLKFNAYLNTAILLSTTILLVIIEDQITLQITFSALISIMSIGIILNRKEIGMATSLENKYKQLWYVVEIFLFILVGISLNMSYVSSIGINILILLVLVLIIRVIGVYICLIATNLNNKEKLFCMIAYIPKATVQASIGGIPLLKGLNCGNIILTIAICSILITAPIGSICIEKSYKKLLKK